MTDPTPIDPARVLAALEVLGWPDDRGEQYAEDAAVMPAEAHYRLAEDVIRAVDAAGCPCLPGAPAHRHGAGGYCTAAPVDDDPRHIIQFRADGWTIKHPLSCRLGDLFGCRVNLAAEDLDGPPMPPGRYEASVSDIDGRLQLGDRVDQDGADR